MKAAAIVRTCRARQKRLSKWISGVGLFEKEAWQTSFRADQCHDPKQPKLGPVSRLGTGKLGQGEASQDKLWYDSAKSDEKGT